MEMTWAGPPQQIRKPPGGREPVRFQRAAHLLITQRKTDIPEDNVLPHPYGRANHDVADKIAGPGGVHEDRQSAAIRT